MPRRTTRRSSAVHPIRRRPRGETASPPGRKEDRPMTPTHPTTPTKPEERQWFRVPDPEDTGAGKFISWGKVPIGFELEGKWLGTREGEYGLYGVIELPGDRQQRFALPAILLKRLGIVDPGVEIKIQYLGPAVSKAGTMYHTFEVLSTTDI